MPFPKNYGALGASFTIARILQSICIIAILGMTANFIGQINANDQVPPKVLVGTLSVVCIAVLYVAISYILYFDSMLPFLISAGADSLLLIALIVVAVTVGKPLSYLDCPALPNVGVTAAFLDSALANLSKINYWIWAGASKTTCYELKAIWGFSISLCVLFAFSSIISVFLWKKQKMFVKKDVEGF